MFRLLINRSHAKGRAFERVFSGRLARSLRFRQVTIHTQADVVASRGFVPPRSMDQIQAYHEDHTDHPCSRPGRRFCIRGGNLSSCGEKL